MEFINAEGFLKQSEKVQDIFMEWWKPEPGDIITVIDNEVEVIVAYKYPCFYRSFNFTTQRFRECYKNIMIPLFTECQLRKFIEDKTGCKISVSPSLEEKYYVGYDAYADNYDGDLKNLVYTDNLLKGYWKVACEIAENNDKLGVK